MYLLSTPNLYTRRIGSSLLSISLTGLAACFATGFHVHEYISKHVHIYIFFFGVLLPNSFHKDRVRIVRKCVVTEKGANYTRAAIHDGRDLSSRS